MMGYAKRMMYECYICYRAHVKFILRSARHQTPKSWQKNHQGSFGMPLWEHPPTPYTFSLCMITFHYQKISVHQHRLPFQRKKVGNKMSESVDWVLEQWNALVQRKENTAYKSAVSFGCDQALRVKICEWCYQVIDIWWVEIFVHSETIQLNTHCCSVKSRSRCPPN